ncbi:MAG: acetyl-CoA carboxylase biotin carboxylase subunit [Ardenticatenaceae bacterium]|nr:acetyl-CoA carboxylase biotin carboxylase subunit [Anaerolineales bacterium]MCB8922005.1 acetyl-CoA carboxylase biotin carboxylase subunit [Ardenticatenaceae bacterium]MCB8989581.1 acetyl-CoA carboxylase biotin carboxylase subunit [Ardenticatenaceae bacterium]MCB9003124.1 acetyl-CoA carboxylase biotin carboxylase subunit [Ardenticatenaceae bacterium]
MFNKILVANRGEIARRIFLACRELGVASVAIYSEADADAPWVRLADESYPLGGVTAVDSYLNQQKVLDVVQLCGAEAIHPGYGFLSENADFARACAAAGIIFIGPSAAAMEMMGSKAAARVLAQRAEVPVVPGVDGAGKSDAELKTAASAMGYPVLIKASAGGGGKGMRVVWSDGKFGDAVQAARREAQSAFGDDHILVEKYFSEIHHVEIQILADQHGRVLHLFERECSIQRRHQKIVEESPAPAVQDEDLRRRMAEAAVSLASAAGYVSAGTVEFIVDGDGRFYFLEMNTRLQVEHPVTELVTGLDLAAWQIRIATGEPLPYQQADIQQRGHAIECRVYAEDPAHNFLPSIGKIALYRPPTGPGVRVDDGIATGAEVTPYYDPMLAKIITWGHDRAEAVRKMVRALQETVVLGVTTNIPYLLAILTEEHFVDGRTTTNYLVEHMADWNPRPEPGEEEWLAVAALELLLGGGKSAPRRAGGEAATQPDPWALVTDFRNV